MPQPIAANLNGASTILAEAFPASFITFDPLVFYRLDYVKKTERLICKVMLDLRSGATAGSGFPIAETILCVYFVKTEGFGVFSVQRFNPIGDILFGKIITSDAIIKKCQIIFFQTSNGVRKTLIIAI